MNRQPTTGLAFLAFAVMLLGSALLLTGCSKSSSTSSGSSGSGSGSSGDGNSGDLLGDILGSSNRQTSSNNLKQIGLALHNYHDVYNRFPAAATTNESGKPLLSWRAALLPYIEHEQLYKQFKLDEPWDSEHNKKLIEKMPKTYLLPGGKEQDGKTHYRAFASAPDVPRESAATFVLPDPMKGQSQPMRRVTDFLDGTSMTLLAAEAEEPVTWTKPDELMYDPKKPVPSLLFNKTGKSNVLAADGAVYSITKATPEKLLRSLITLAGGEMISEKEWPPAR